MIFDDDYKLENKNKEYCWLGLTDKEFEEIINSNFNPLLNRSELELKNMGLRELFLMQNPDYFYFIGRFILNLELYPLQVAVLRELWNHPFNLLMASRGFSKTFTLAVYCLLKLVLQPGIKIVGIGAAFRQSKLIYAYMEQIWNNAPVLRGLYKGEKQGPRLSTDNARFTLGTSVATFVPIGDGSRIRGLRAQVILADEFDSIPVEIFQTVVEGFAAVSANPIENMKKSALEKRLKESGEWDEKFADEFSVKRNQSIISGTVGDIHGNLQDYFKKYSTIIKTKGDAGHFKEVFGDKVPEGIDHKDFCVIRIPYEKVPSGFMDAQSIAKAKVTNDPAIFAAEYGCCPITDTNGFYKKSLIDSCTATYKNTQKEYWPEWCPEEFTGIVRGNPKYNYVYGIDPAHSNDNFAIVILEVRENHSRVVYCWTTNKKVFQEQKKTIDEENYYAYCAKKIRALMMKFPTDNIVIDSQGGGIAVCEALHDKDKIEADELPLWPIIDPEKPQDTDMRAGRHILHITNMSQPWNAEANHAMRKDLEDRILLFPAFDAVLAGLADEAIPSSVDYDRQDDCMLEIEDLKKELITIVKQQTPTGKERWDTPDNFTNTKIAGGERMRKDRFSALLLANSVARGVKVRMSSVHRIDTTTFSVGMVGQIEKRRVNPHQVQDNPYTQKIPARLHRGISR